MGSVRWYMLFSAWIFIASVFYPYHKISTFPLNCLALLGFAEVIGKPWIESPVKRVFLVLIHTLPFLWIPMDFGYKTLFYNALFAISYLTFMNLMNLSVLRTYMTVMYENHKTFREYLRVRIG